MTRDDSLASLLGFHTTIVRPQVLHSTSPKGNKLTLQQANLKERRGNHAKYKCQMYCALQVGCQAASWKVYVNCTPHNRKMYTLYTLHSAHTIVLRSLGGSAL